MADPSGSSIGQMQFPDNPFSKPDGLALVTFVAGVGLATYGVVGGGERACEVPAPAVTVTTAPSRIAVDDDIVVVDHHDGVVDPQQCRLAALPGDVTVLAAGGYTGRELDWQIDQSGHQATQIDATVTTPGKVALVLGAYEPTIWNLRWTAGTEIVAVIATGYHRQALAGLPGSVPVLVSTYDGTDACGRFDDVYGERATVDAIAQHGFGRAVGQRYAVDEERGIVALGAVTNAPTLTSPETPVASFRDPHAPLAGPAGLARLVERGLLRKMTPDEADDIRRACPAHEDLDEALAFGAYVVTGAFAFPAGLYGANSATFFVPRGIPAPTGEPGHSTVIASPGLPGRAATRSVAQSIDANKRGPSCTTL